MLYNDADILAHRLQYGLWRLRKKTDASARIPTMFLLMMFLLGLATLGLMFAFVAACDVV